MRINISVSVKRVCIRIFSGGDFDNDGKEKELEIIRDGSGSDYYMQVFRVDSNINIGSAIFSKSPGKREDTDNCNDNIFRSSYVPHFGIIAEAGDIDNNGSD